MTSARHNNNRPNPLQRVNFVLLRLIILSLAALLVVAGTAVLIRHLMKPETIAKVRLERDGYPVTEEGVFQAIGREDPLALLRLKTAGISLMCRNEEGRTPYEVAIMEDRLMLLDILAELGATPDLKPVVFEEFLVKALQRGAWETAALLLGRGTSPEVEVEPGLPALVWAMATGKEEAVELWLQSKAKIEVDSKLGTPLVLAYAKEDYGLFDRLLSLGANPDQKELGGRTLGVASVVDGREVYTRRLLAAGAEVRGVSEDGMTMLEAAFVKRAEPVFVELVQAGAELKSVSKEGLTYLERAAVEQDYHWMELLLAQGLDPNQRTAGRNDPLWWSRFDQGDPVGAEILLGAGADINAPDGAGLSPIDLAIQRGNFRMTRYLFARGAETYGKIWEPLRERKYGMLRLVVANGADASNPTSLGVTPLAYTIRAGDLTGAALLMEYGARYDSNDRPDGHSLLEWAMANRQLPMIELLVKQGADVNVAVSKPQHPEFLEKFSANGNLLYHLKNDSNVRPIMVAAGSSQLDAAKLLLQHGAKRNVYTSRNRSYPVTFAIRTDNLPMAQLMLGREPEMDGNYVRKVVVNRAEQRARFYRNGELIYSTRCSTGKSGHRTPGGTFVITDKTKLRYSTIYGSAMPYFHRLSGSAVGMHQGYVPGYPASAGCIRLPYEYAKIFYENTQVGDIIVVE